MFREIVKKIIGARGVRMYQRCNRFRRKQYGKLFRKRLERKAYAARMSQYRSFIKPGELVFDVGANMGNRVASLLETGARVVAVEPQQVCWQALEEKFGDRITIVKKGVDSAPGTKEFYLSDESALSSFSREWIDAVKAHRFTKSSWDNSVRTEMTTLDALIGEYGVPVFIKMDIEGFESEALKGLSQPVGCISFEYAVPDRPENAVACVRRLMELDPEMRFNYCVGESHRWAMKRWLDGEQMCRRIGSPAFIRTGFGDIYARMALSAASPQ